MMGNDAKATVREIDEAIQHVREKRKFLIHVAARLRLKRAMALKDGR